MKKALVTVALLIQTMAVFAATTTIKQTNVNWNSTSSWNQGRLPQTGDTVIVPTGQAVILSNAVYSNKPKLYIKVSGTISFQPSGKLDLGNNSVVEVTTGGSIITSGTGSERIYIGGVLKYKGQADGTITGFALANSSSGSSGSGAGSGFITQILDIILKDFNAVRKNNSVNITWSTLSETETDYFEIQSSTDRNDWSTINKINAGNYSTGNYYSINDSRVLSTNTYYRLKMVNKTGSITYSEISLIRYNGIISKMSVYPNPATDYIYITLNQNANNGTIRLSSFEGKTVINKNISNSSGIVKLETQNLPKGIYVVEVKDANNNIETNKVIIN
ncbi:MAG: T9SS type A sorting domain-containing protein [Sphingobacteriales bacterium]|nr:T9SS type A sorting domain-containing protein [Sphingobacteriales bacterium]MBI3717049.1 T9SS type A sorting domain-containing protein [Sphingobacteriales bacterium]